jgi:hypothetical protein
MGVYYGTDYMFHYIVWNRGSHEEMDIICSLRGVEYDHDDDFAYGWYLDYNYDHTEMMEMVEIIKTAGIKVKEDSGKLSKKSKRIVNE